MSSATQLSLRRTYQEIDIDLIDDPDIELRQHIEEESLNELSASIADRDMLSPVLVTTRPNRSRYVLIAGGRRVRGAKKASKKHVPGYVYEDVPANEALEMALIENVQRDNLEPMWEARAYAILKEKFNTSVEDIAKRLRKRVQHVKERLALLGLPLDIQRKIEEKTIPTTSAVAIAKIKDENVQRAMAEKAEQEHLPYNVVKRMVEESVSKVRRRKKRRQQPTRQPGSPWGERKRDQAERHLQETVLKGEELLRQLGQIDLAQWQKSDLRKLQSGVNAIQQGLSKFQVQVSTLLK
ncbi:MAG: ParB/RepB/Spo0J family partition protein [Candidatus Andersenbacteria bacterium]|nr:ParB/RepB/Spo0J family partition protein [Candidatus Andersenbacteria bacterium]